MAFPRNTATNGTDAQNLLVNYAAAQGIAQPAGGLSQIDMLSLVVANMLQEAATGTVTPLALSSTVIDGLGTLRVARATFDPSANTSQRTEAAHNLGVTLPISSVVVGGFVQVNTAFTGVGASIAIHVQAANDIVSAAAISGAPWSTIGQKAIVPKANTPESTGVVCTAARAITATVTGAALTAGKAVVFLYYVPGNVSA